MSATATVRVHAETRDALRRLAVARATTIPEVLREMVQRAEDDELLGGMEADFDHLASDPEQESSYRAEAAEWDATLLDGLEHG